MSGVASDDAAGVGAGGKAAVVGVGVGQPFAVGVGFGKKDTGGLVVGPGGGVAHAGGIVAVGGHGGAVAEGVVGVADGIDGTTLVGLVAAQVVVVDRHVAEGIGDGGCMAHDVVGVGRPSSRRWRR